MKQLTPQQALEYLHRSYGAVDGLWFMMAEETYGFDAALDLDEKVWRVLPKIQARTLKRLLGLDSGLAALRDAFTAKLHVDGFDFSAELTAERLTITINQCPWLALLEKSNRTHLAGTIGRRICNAEYGVWAAEFGPGIAFRLDDMLCDGGGRCTLVFDADSIEQAKGGG